jgi:2-methylisocitrate lyase-like PEP mutase family enzyme
MIRAKEFRRIGVDAVFGEALPDREAMSQCVQELDMPVFANGKSMLQPYELRLTVQ